MCEFEFCEFSSDSENSLSFDFFTSVRVTECFTDIMDINGLTDVNGYTINLLPINHPPNKI